MIQSAAAADLRRCRFQPTGGRQVVTANFRQKRASRRYERVICEI